MREIKPVMFGNSDVDLFQQVSDMKNFSGYVKRLIREDLKKKVVIKNDTTIEDKIDEILYLIKKNGSNAKFNEYLEINNVDDN